jgi:hypothetical protein
LIGIPSRIFCWFTFKDILLGIPSLQEYPAEPKYEHVFSPQLLSAVERYIIKVSSHHLAIFKLGR